MFGKKKKDTEREVIVKTKEELKAAIKRKEPYIEVQGDLANKMKWMGGLSKKKVAAFVALLAVAASNPVTGGAAAAGSALSAKYLVAQGVVNASESIAAYSLIIMLGIVTVLAIFREYSIVIEINPPKVILVSKYHNVN